MTPGSDDREANGTEDPAMVRFVQLLRRAETVSFPEADRLRIATVIGNAARTAQPADRADQRASNRRWLATLRRPQLAVLAILAILVSTGVVFGAGNILDLGRPTNTTSTNAYFPLSGFHRVSVSLRQGGKPEFLFLGVDEDAAKVSIERWPVVKALSQFGRLSGVTAVDSQCTTVHGAPQGSPPSCTTPTYDFTHAKYRSRYLAFVSKDLLRIVGEKERSYQHLSSTERQIFHRFAETKHTPVCYRKDSNGNPIRNASNQLELYPCKSYIDYIDATVNNGTERTLPLLLVGNYLQTVTEDLNQGDFSQAIELTPPSSAYPAYGYQRPFSFETIRAALASGKNPGTTSSSLVQDVNAEANVITALICHADGNRPAGVCGRSVIKTILKHVK